MHKRYIHGYRLAWHANSTGELIVHAALVVQAGRGTWVCVCLLCGCLISPLNGGASGLNQGRHVCPGVHGVAALMVARQK
jgi:hypothetical protein